MEDHFIQAINLMSISSYIEYETGNIYVLERKKITSPPNEWHNIPLCENFILQRVAHTKKV